MLPLPGRGAHEHARGAGGTDPRHEEAEMLAVRCPQVATARGARLVGERHITGMAVLDGRRLLTVACPCGSEHVLDLGRHGAVPAG